MKYFSAEERDAIRSKLVSMGVKEAAESFGVVPRTICRWRSFLNLCRRKKYWSVSEKIQIIKEAKKFGFLETATKYGVHNSTIYSWNRLLKAGDLTIKGV